jgi:hypothetical protein
MATKHTCTLTIDVSEKTVTQSGVMGIRETIDVILVDSEDNGYGAADLRLWIIGKINGTRTLLAKCETFTETDGTGVPTADTGIFEGELDLNTEELCGADDVTGYFDGFHDQAIRSASMVVQDVTNQDTLVNDQIELQNCPLEDSMADPNPVDPIVAVDYAPLANGVTNGDSHNHNGGDGDTISHLHLSDKGTNTHADIDAWKLLVDAAATAAGGILKCNRLALKQPNGSFREIVVDDNGVIGTGGTV